MNFGIILTHKRIHLIGLLYSILNNDCIPTEATFQFIPYFNRTCTVKKMYYKIKCLKSDVFGLYSSETGYKLIIVPSSARSSVLSFSLVIYPSFIWCHWKSVGAKVTAGLGPFKTEAINVLCMQYY